MAAEAGTLESDAVEGVVVAELVPVGVEARPRLRPLRLVPRCLPAP